MSDRPIRTIHVASGDLWGGAEAMLLDLTAAQIEMGETVAAIVFNDGLLAARLRHANIPTTILPESRLSPPELLRAIRRSCLSFRPDVIHTHRIKEMVIGALAARTTGVPVCVRTVHGDSEHDLRWYQVRKRLARFAERLTSITMIDATVAVSIELGARMRRRSATGRIEVIENGIDPARVRRHAAEDNSVRQRMPGSIRVGIVGRLVPVKRVDHFITSCDVLAQATSCQIEAVVVGDGPLRANLEEQARGMPSVSWTFTGFSDNPAAWIRTLDLLAITSDHEGLPMCLLEGIALGVPIVARAVGGIPHVMRERDYGRLVDSADPTDFSAAMRAALDDRADSRLATTPQSFPLEFLASTSARRYHSLYATLIALKTAPGRRST